MRADKTCNFRTSTGLLTANCCQRSWNLINFYQLSPTSISRVMIRINETFEELKQALLSYFVKSLPVKSLPCLFFFCFSFVFLSKQKLEKPLQQCEFVFLDIQFINIIIIIFLIIQFINYYSFMLDETCSSSVSWVIRTDLNFLQIWVEYVFFKISLICPDQSSSSTATAGLSNIVKQSALLRRFKFVNIFILNGKINIKKIIEMRLDTIIIHARCS